MPEGTVAFAGDPLLRVTAPRIEAQLIETLLLNQINFQTVIATKAARLVLAAVGGAIVDFAPRRDHGVDAAIEAARAAAIAGAAGTSNVAAATRYGLTPVGTMAHSYVMSFPTVLEAFRAFMRDTPDNAVMLVDTYDTVEGVRRAIAAPRETGVPLKCVRLDSGDRLALSRTARELLHGAGMRDAAIVVSGDLEEHQITELVAAGAPVDVWGVGTDLGTSRDSPTVSGEAGLPARCRRGHVRGRARRRRREVARQPLLERVMRDGRVELPDSLDVLRARAATGLRALPWAAPYPVVLSDRLVRLTADVTGMAPAALAGRSSSAAGPEQRFSGW